MRTAILDDPCFSEHTSTGHPENRDRLIAIRNRIADSPLNELIEKRTARYATMQELELCHTRNYIQYVKELSESGAGMLDIDTYVNNASYEAASKCAGGMIDIAKAVMTGELKNGFALTRPPGHHALASNAMGFCIFGTVALAASAMKVENLCEKSVIIDFDIHHGNGTQSLIGPDPSILYISTHQFPFYPRTGSIHDIGKSGSEGSIINIPLPKGTGDEGLHRVYEEVVFPCVEQFDPQIIIVSAGFDGHWRDYLGGLNFSLSGYSWLANSLLKLADNVCDGRIVFCLEGGYDIEILAQAVSNTLNLMIPNGGPPVDPAGPYSGEEPDLKSLVADLKKIHL